ncbi:hypothetical protein EJ110_NYTH52512 [Nymphaea thermarum]|nr:hypothetical protein EJ110_NYTH52512 [Nymphaea thermarum]
MKPLIWFLTYPTRLNIVTSSLKLTTLEGLSKLPINRHSIVAGDGPAVAGGDLEGEGLAIEVGIALPVLAPIALHGLPPGLRSLDGHRVNVPRAPDVGDQHQIEVPNQVRRQRQYFLPSECNWNNPRPVPSNLQKSRLSQIKVLEGRVAPPAIVVRQHIVGRAEVGGRHRDRARQAPLRVVGALHLVAGPAAQPVIEQSSAKCSCERAISLTV